MKLIFISFFTLFLSYTSPTTVPDEAPMSFLVEITHADGTVDSKVISLDQLKDGYDAAALGLVVNTDPGGGGGNCTWGWENSDECKVTAPTCAAAQAGFEACACELDNTHPFCPGEDDPGNN